MTARSRFPLAPHALFAACLLLTAAIYWPGLGGDYLFDDRANLLENRALAMDELSMTSLQQAALSSRAGNLRRPLSMASFALNRYFFGIDPWSFKVTNLLLHLLTGLLLYGLSRRLLDLYRQHRQADMPVALCQWLPLVVAGLWLVHPLNLTSVLYIVQRMTSLSTLFMVCGLYLYVIGRGRMLDGRHGMAWMLAGLAGMGILAVLSKETGVLLPLYILVIEAVLFRFRDATGQIDRSVTGFFVILVLLPILAGCVYLLAHTDAYLNYGGREFTLAERLLTEARVVVFYIRLLIAPSIRQLGLYHDDIAISTGLLNPASTLFSILALAALLLAALRMFRHQPLISLGILWFLAGHLLESTVLPLEIAHEHRNYLPGFGLLLAGSAAIASIRLKKIRPALVIALPVLLLLLFSGTTLIRSMQWSDNINHAIYEARHHPESPRAVFSAGRIHARLALQGHAKSIDPAFASFTRAAELDTRGIMPLVAPVKLAYLLGRPVDPARIDEMIRRLENRPATPSDIRALQELADCTSTPCDIPPASMEKLFVAAHKNRNARLLSLHGFYIINKLGDTETGLSVFRRAVELAPGHGEYWKNLINLLMVMTEFDEAQATLDRFRSVRPLGTTVAMLDELQADIDEGRRQMQTAQREYSDHE